jgi:hypothetical protein
VVVVVFVVGALRVVGVVIMAVLVVVVVVKSVGLGHGESSKNAEVVGTGPNRCL